MYLYYIHCLAEEVKNDAGGALDLRKACIGMITLKSISDGGASEKFSVDM